jgi:hypothetical protein
MLLVAFAVSMILEKNIWCTSFNLAFNNSFPKFLSFNSFLSFTFFFIFCVELNKFISINLEQTFSFIGTEKSPFSIFFDSLHEKVWYPKSVKKISCSLFLFTVILSHIEEVKYICMPWFQINGK